MKSRGWGAVLDAIAGIQSLKPDRRPDNIEVTKRMACLLGLEDATKKIPMIHVAGTKGKGTTCAFASHLFQGAGLKVGLFTSPHLVDVRERIMINNQMLSRDAFAKYFFEIYDRQKRIENDAPSEYDRSISRSAFFRFTFFLAMHVFAVEKVDVAVMEVGIGGRLDSTNIITPQACGITALGWDHIDVLGATLEHISAEKAGIMKKDIPCFVDKQRDHPETLNYLRRHAHQVGTPILPVDEHIFPKIRQWPPLAMTGEFMLDNAMLALAMFRYAMQVPLLAPLHAIEAAALSKTRVDGRCQVLPMHESSACTVFMDGAHTEESIAKASTWFLQEAGRLGLEKRPTVLVLYTTREPRTLFKHLKDVARTAVAAIFVHVDNTRLAGGEREARQVLQHMEEAWRQLYPEVPAMVHPGMLESAEQLRELVGAPPPPQPQQESVPGDDGSSNGINVFATGSLYLVGSLLRVLRPVPPE